LVFCGLTQSLAAPPKVNHLFPAGGQRGQTIAVMASGEFSNWPVQLWADRPGITATCDKDKGKLQIAVAADAEPGIYWLRLYDGEGASQFRPFVVGTLSEVAEVETNDTPDKPQVVEPRLVVNGKLAKRGDVDGYRVDLKQGQTLVASVQGNSLLGSPMDSVLQVCELIERRTSSIANAPATVEAFPVAHNHDAIGLDPQIIFTAERDGQYLVRLFAFPSEPNSSIQFSGDEAYIYRLTITTGGYLDHPLPLAIGSDPAAAKLAGWNIPESATTLSLPGMTPPADPLSPPDGQIEWAWHPELAGAFRLPRLEHACVVAEEANSPDQPQAVSVPITISGRLETAGDIDAFAVQATKDQKLRIDVAAKSLGFPLDAIVAVLDDAGKTLAEADDNGRSERDPELVFTAPADGRYRVVIRDLAGRGDLRLAYRLTIAPPAPDFTLSLAADSFVLEAGKPLEIPVTINRQDGFAEAVELLAIGLPPAVTCEIARSEAKGDSAKTVKLVLKGEGDALQAGGVPIRIEGRTSGDKPLVRSARFPVSLPLADPHWAAWLTVKK
jgi:hypothetical protein